MGFLKKKIEGMLAGESVEGVRGAAQVISSSTPQPHAKMGRGELELVVSADGIPATAVTHTGILRTDRWPMPGQTLPITVDPNDTQRIEIHWDEIQPSSQLASQQAQQIAALMNAQQTGSTNLSRTPAGLSDDQAARVNQALASLGGLGAASVIDLRGPAGSRGEATGRDPVEQLEKLAELQRSGVLTDAEFEQQKQRILGQS